MATYKVTATRTHWYEVEVQASDEWEAIEALREWDAIDFEESNTETGAQWDFDATEVD